MKVLVVIPARYASSRFPGKPLVRLGGMPLVQWVWSRVVQMPFVADAVVATDDDRIMQVVRQFGGNAMMTGSRHRSGTDRCGEVLESFEAEGKHFDVVVNVQGDEPFVQQDQLSSLIGCFANKDTQIATLKTAIRDGHELRSANNVKVVCGIDGRALYFSRQPIPHLRGAEPSEWLARRRYFKHVGIYAFRSEVLKEVVRLEPSDLELCESLEQLRWLENGYSIAVRETGCASIGIDTPEDLAAAERFLLNMKK